MPSSINGDQVVDKAVRVRRTFNRFSDNTTAHGIPRIPAARNHLGSLFWIIVVAICSTIFLTEAMLLINKFVHRQPSTTVTLKFDQVEFPAITFCNLNPYKKSLINMVPTIRDTMDVYDNAKSHSKEEVGSGKKKLRRKQHAVEGENKVRELFAKEIAEGLEELKSQQKQLGIISKFDEIMEKDGERVKREIPPRRFEAIEAHCKCVGKLDMECIRFESPPKDDSSTCVCTYDREMMVAWPCFNMSIWYDHSCPVCSEEGYCEAFIEGSQTAHNEEMGSQAASADWPCKCRNRTYSTEPDDRPYCIGKKPIEILKYWVESNETTTTSTTQATTTISTTPAPTTPPPKPKPNQRAIVSNPETIKAMGFGEMTDGVAMLTKAKENLMFTMAALSKEQRIALSQSKHEFIEMCSFNGHECNIDEDFRLHVDPEFGNCFTFNYDVNNNYTSSRAGPMYGIRVLLFVNTSDYMSTSESSGIRLAIHSPTEYPFPDTFGYSAPVGFASSFGMKKQIVKRLPVPIGHCVDTALIDSDDYIYHGYDYQPEGCHRSCFQNNLIEDCSCGDPRFPVPPGQKHCSAFNATARACLESNIGSVGDFHHVTERMKDCICKHSCTEIVHEVTFSASKWPSGATDLGDCEGMTEKECEQYYRLNAAMIEVFYEQLNYELLQESEAYSLVNLIADFGGHLGLWLGFSIITVIECIVLGLDMLTIAFTNKRIIKTEDAGRIDRRDRLDKREIREKMKEKDAASRMI